MAGRGRGAGGLWEMGPVGGWHVQRPCGQDGRVLRALQERGVGGEVQGKGRGVRGEVRGGRGLYFPPEPAGRPRAGFGEGARASDSFAEGLLAPLGRRGLWDQGEPAARKGDSGLVIE